MKLLKNLALSATVVAATLTLATPVLAGKSRVSGSIELGSVTARSSAAISPTYGTEVGFSTSVDGNLATSAELVVTVICEQNNLIVYYASGDPDSSFPLVSAVGTAFEWDGSDASCIATLVYSYAQGRKVVVQQLDRTPFEVGGTVG